MQIKLLKKGVMMMVLSSLLASSTVQARTLDVVATAYCACKQCCGRNAKGITASGLPVQVGMIAVDKKVIKLGTRVKIKGMGTFLAADTGSAIRGRRIDIFYESHQAALNFGRQKIRIEF